VTLPSISSRDPFAVNMVASSTICSTSPELRRRRVAQAHVHRGPVARPAISAVALFSSRYAHFFGPPPLSVGESTNTWRLPVAPAKFLAASKAVVEGVTLTGVKG
jgi:hypothetical protein